MSLGPVLGGGDVFEEVASADAPASKENVDPKICNELVAAQLRKTKLCESFKQGICDDPLCSFAHSREELRRPPDLTKTAICRAYTRKKCSAKDCKYAHGEQELRVTPDVYKTQLCNFHERGWCKKGENCRHAHGQAELKEFVAKALNNRQFVTEESQQSMKISLDLVLRPSQEQNKKEPMKVQLPSVPAPAASAPPPGLPAPAPTMPIGQGGVAPPPWQQLAGLVSLQAMQMVNHMVATAGKPKNTELQQLNLKGLKKRAKEAGATDTEVEDLDGEDDPKRAAIALISKYEARLVPLREKLSTMNLKQLKMSAHMHGVSPESLEAVDEASDPKAAAIELIVVAVRCTQANAATDVGCPRSTLTEANACSPTPTTRKESTPLGGHADTPLGGHASVDEENLSAIPTFDAGNAAKTLFKEDSDWTDKIGHQPGLHIYAV